jgi:hypothetical protein
MELFEERRLEDYKKKYAKENKATSCIEKAAYYILHEFHYSLLELEKDYGTRELDNLFESIVECCDDESTFNEKEAFKKIDEYFYPKIKNKRKNLFLRILSTGGKSMARATAFYKTIYEKGPDGSITTKRGNVFPSYVDKKTGQPLSYGDEGGELKYGNETWNLNENHDYNEDQKKRFFIEPAKN